MAWPTSQGFRDTLTASHEVVTTVTVVHGQSTVYRGLPFTGGTVTVDEQARNRRDLSLTVIPGDLAGVDLEPRDLTDLLSPALAELHVWSGVRVVGSAEVEMVPVGVFVDPAVSRSSRFGPMSVRAGDRCQRVTDARFVRPFTVARGEEVVEVIRTLLLSVNSLWEVYDLTGARARTSGAVYERDRWEALDGLAKTIGAEVVPDQAGRWLIRPVPVVPTLAEAVAAVGADGDGTCWEYRSGDRGALVDLGTELSLDGVYNAVVATGEPGDGQPPVSGWAHVASGPLRWGSTVGRQKPRFYSSPLLTTDAQCVRAARSMLSRATAFSRTLDPVALPNPAADVGDWALISETIRNPAARRWGERERTIRTPAVHRRIDLPLTGEQGAMGVQVRVAGDVVDGEGDLT